MRRRSPDRTKRLWPQYDCNAAAPAVALGQYLGENWPIRKATPTNDAAELRRLFAASLMRFVLLLLLLDVFSICTCLNSIGHFLWCWCWYSLVIRTN